MILNLDQIRAITHGALIVRANEEGGAEFCRFTDTQKAYYEQTDSGFFRKSHATSGVRLEFVTDSNSLSFTYSVQYASSRRFYYFDIFVDGVMTEHFGHENISRATADFSMTLPEGTHTVCIYLPCLCEAHIYNFTLDDGAIVAPVSRPLKLLCYGDSITQGYDAKYPSQTYANLLADKLHAEMVDQGIGGEHFCPGLLAESIGYEPDIITVAYGTNDWSNQPRDLTVQNAGAFYAELRRRYPRAKIFGISPIWRADNDRVTKVGLFEEGAQIVRDAVNTNGAILVEGTYMIPHLREVCSDRYLHPNDMGFKFYANALYNAMLPYLKEDLV